MEGEKQFLRVSRDFNTDAIAGTPPPNTHIHNHIPFEIGFHYVALAGLKLDM